MTGVPSRRFWTQAGTAPAPGGHALLLDGKPVRSPARAPLVLPTRALAQALAREWDAQGESILPASMPLTRAANVAIDGVSGAHAAVAEMVAAYGQSDLLCYRADDPPGLVARQQAAWDPLLAWAAEVLDAPLTVTSGVMHAAQPASSLARLRACVAALDPFALTAMHDLVTLSGSLVLGLAVQAKHSAPDRAWTLSRIDEDWQAEKWGLDAEAADAASERRAAFQSAARLLTLLEEPDA
ncbi:MAG: ATP12 family protein [Pseudomonadota bacterium]